LQQINQKLDENVKGQDLSETKQEKLQEDLQKLNAEKNVITWRQQNPNATSEDFDSKKDYYNEQINRAADDYLNEWGGKDTAETKEAFVEYSEKVHGIVAQRDAYNRAAMGVDTSVPVGDAEGTWKQRAEENPTTDYTDYIVPADEEAGGTTPENAYGQYNGGVTGNYKPSELREAEQAVTAFDIAFNKIEEQTGVSDQAAIFANIADSSPSLEVKPDENAEIPIWEQAAIWLKEAETETGMTLSEAEQFKKEQEEKFGEEILGSRGLLENPEDVKELYGEIGEDINISSDYVFGYTGEINIDKQIEGIQMPVINFDNIDYFTEEVLNKPLEQLTPEELKWRLQEEEKQLRDDMKRGFSGIEGAFEREFQKALNTMEEGYKPYFEMAMVIERKQESQYELSGGLVIENTNIDGGGEKITNTTVYMSQYTAKLLIDPEKVIHFSPNTGFTVEQILTGAVDIAELAIEYAIKPKAMTQFLNSVPGLRGLITFASVAYELDKQLLYLPQIDNSLLDCMPGDYIKIESVGAMSTYQNYVISHTDGNQVYPFSMGNYNEEFTLDYGE